MTVTNVASAYRDMPSERWPCAFFARYLPPEKLRYILKSYGSRRNELGRAAPAIRWLVCAGRRGVAGARRRVRPRASARRRGGDGGARRHAAEQGRHRRGQPDDRRHRLLPAEAPDDIRGDHRPVLELAERRCGDRRQPADEGRKPRQGGRRRLSAHARRVRADRRKRHVLCRDRASAGDIAQRDRGRHQDRAARLLGGGLAGRRRGEPRAGRGLRDEYRTRQAGLRGHRPGGARCARTARQAAERRPENRRADGFPRYRRRDPGPAARPDGGAPPWASRRWASISPVRPRCITI